MRQGRFLNVILTINAVLLTALLWVQLAGSSGLASSAYAQAAGDGSGIPNAASQRQKMIESLNELKSSVEGMRKALEGGKLKVEVTNLKDIKFEQK